LQAKRFFRFALPFMNDKLTNKGAYPQKQLAAFGAAISCFVVT
jgi:hypothetical protein